MKRAFLSRVARVVCASMLCLFASMQAWAHGVTLKVQHALQADSALHTQFLVPWTKALEEASHGRFRFQLLPGAAGDAAQLLEQVKQGGVDIGYVVIERSGRFPEFEQFSAPADAKSAGDASHALWDYVRANDLAKKEFDGVRLLAVGVPAKGSLSVLVMNPAAFKSLTDDLKQEINKSSGSDTSALIGRAYDAAGK